MAAGWNVFKNQAIREPPKYVLDSKAAGPQDRAFQLRWIQGKREDTQERRLITWICKITGLNSPAGNIDFGEWLKDGSVLCKLMNTVQPGSIKRVHPKGEYALRENVGNFLSACKKYGLREEDCFCSTDLCDKGDLSLVASTLFSLAELAHSRDKNIPLP